MLLASLLAGASAGVPAVLSVPALARAHGTLSGRVVQVRGRLAECQPRSCGLLDDERFAAPVAWLSFAPAPAFDAATRAAIGRRVVVEGKVLAGCWPTPGGRIAPACTDRAPQFRPERIVRVLDGPAGEGRAR